YCALYFPLALALLRFVDRRTRLPLVVTTPVVWTALEFFRAHFGTGFAWYFLGHTQHDFLPIIQISDLTGAYGVTFLVAAVNALLFEVGYRLLSPKRQRGEHSSLALRAQLAVQAVFVLLLAGACYGYGDYRLSQNEFAPGPRVALI